MIEIANSKFDFKSTFRRQKVLNNPFWLTAVYSTPNLWNDNNIGPRYQLSFCFGKASNQPSAKLFVLWFTNECCFCWISTPNKVHAQYHEKFNMICRQKFRFSLVFFEEKQWSWIQYFCFNNFSSMKNEWFFRKYSVPILKIEEEFMVNISSNNKKLKSFWWYSQYYNWTK